MSNISSHKKITKVSPNEIDLPDISVVIDKEKLCLILNYRSKSNRATYSISCPNGRIFKTDVVANTGITQIDLSNYPKPTFNLIIVDGEDILQKLIEL